jgi:Fur family transcriptional regulator, ferric uptake regulator
MIFFITEPALKKRYHKLLVYTSGPTGIKLMTTATDLKSIGLKATLPRMKILELFQSGDHRHLSAEDVYKLLLQENLDIGLATVYRVLTQFAQAGLLTRQNFETGKSVFELNEGEHHDHLVCVQCGKVVEFFDEEIERRQKEIAEKLGFDLQAHALSLYGLCKQPECNKRRK